MEVSLRSGAEALDVAGKRGIIAQFLRTRDIEGGIVFVLCSGWCDNIGVQYDEPGCSCCVSSR